VFVRDVPRAGLRAGAGVEVGLVPHLALAAQASFVGFPEPGASEGKAFVPAVVGPAPLTSPRVRLLERERRGAPTAGCSASRPARPAPPPKLVLGFAFPRCVAHTRLREACERAGGGAETAVRRGRLEHPHAGAREVSGADQESRGESFVHVPPTARAPPEGSVNRHSSSKGPT
jgi:hypothetical protein